MNQPRFRMLAALVATYVVAGGTLAAVAMSFQGRDWGFAGVLGYAALFASQQILLGLCVGMANIQWWARILAAVLSVAWLAFIGFAPFGDPSPRYELIFEVTVPPMLVAAFAACCRRWIARIEFRDQWPTPSIVEEFRFSLRSMIYLMVTIGLLLGGGRIVQSIGGDAAGTAVFGGVFAFTTLLVAAILLWGALTCGRARVRAP